MWLKGLSGERRGDKKRGERVYRGMGRFEEVGEGSIEAARAAKHRSISSLVSMTTSDQTECLVAYITLVRSPGFIFLRKQTLEYFSSFVRSCPVLLENIGGILFILLVYSHLQ